METQDARTRLMALAAERQVSLAALSAFIGRNASYLQQFVRKGSPRKLEEGDRRKLAHFFGVEDSELSGAEEISFTPQSGKPRMGAARDWVDVPRLALDASAGPGALAQEERAVGAFRFARGWMRAQGLDPAWLSAIAVAGDSMQPTLNDGDEILVDRQPQPPREGLYVVRVGEGLLVKRLDFGRPHRVVLISDNPAYPPQDLPEDEVAIIGRVVWKSGRL